MSGFSGGEWNEAGHALGRTVVLTHDQGTNESYAIRSTSGVVHVRIMDPVSSSVTVSPTSTGAQVLTQAATVNTVINTTTDNLSLYDSNDGVSGDPIAVLPPAMALPSPIEVVSGLVLKTAGIGALGLATVLYALT